MPRQARLDSPGLLQHVMARGLNRQKIFLDRVDYEDFLRRVEAALKRSPSEILAWALMSNHLHFLVRSGPQGLSAFMRRLLTGYALGFNARHKRTGYLFQGRYKSLVCDEEEYLLTLVRYIHLNPLAAGLVASMKALQTYPYTGHRALMGKEKRSWEAVDEVLGRFGKQASIARRRYETFLADGLPEVRKQPVDLLGGGLLDALQESGRHYRREEDRALSDSRVLGESEFVSRVWEETEKRNKVQTALKRRKIDIRQVAKQIAGSYQVDERRLFERGRAAPVSAAKAALIYAGVEWLGKTTAEMARLTRMTAPAASQARVRGEAIRENRQFSKLISILRPL